jgi:hypothetical protein
VEPENDSDDVPIYAKTRTIPYISEKREEGGTTAKPGNDPDPEREPKTTPFS